MGFPLQALRPEDIPLPDWIRQQLDCYGPEGLLCVDGQATILGWNAGLEDMLGIDVEHEPPWVLEPAVRILGLDGDDAFSALLARAQEDGFDRATIPGRLAENRSAALELTAVRASDGPGATAFLVFVREEPAAPAPPAPDPQLNRAFMELQVQNRMLMNRAGGLVLLVDPEAGTILHANEGAEEYLRAPVGELRGQPIAAVIERVDGFTSHGDAGVFLGGARRETELTIPSKSGNAWVVEFVSNTIAWHGKPALLWIGRDVSHRRSVPRADSGGVRLPSALVTPLVEELRHPATGIEAAARACLNAPDRPWHEQRERLEQIQELGDRVRAASEDLLYLARIADGTLDIRRTETTVGRLLAGLLPRLQRRARSARSELMVVQADEQASLFSDVRLLMRALRGFLERPLDCEGATVTLTVRAEGDCVRFVIIDSGSAQEGELLKHILDPRGIAKASSGEFPGMEHLPMMLSVHLFRAIGGHVEVQSSPGLGSQVTLTLVG